MASRHDGMAGVLLIHHSDGDLPVCLTLEDPWRNNRIGESCIPAGAYVCRLVQTQAFGFTYLVLDVPGRIGILFHWGNTQEETKGCILLGRAFSATVDDKLDIEMSRLAFQAIMVALARHEEFDLVVEDCWGGRTVPSTEVS